MKRKMKELDTLAIFRLLSSTLLVLIQCNRACSVHIHWTFLSPFIHQHSISCVVIISMRYCPTCFSLLWTATISPEMKPLQFFLSPNDKLTNGTSRHSGSHESQSERCRFNDALDNNWMEVSFDTKAFLKRFSRTTKERETIEMCSVLLHWSHCDRESTPQLK